MGFAPQMIAIWAFPNSDDWGIRVSFEYPEVKLICVLDEPNAAMTRESVRRLGLILVPSICLVPVAPVC